MLLLKKYENGGVSMGVKENIRKIRLLKGFSQKYIEEKTKIHNRLIQMYESGKRVPKQENLQKIADALDVDIWALKDIDVDVHNDESIRQIFFQLEEKGAFNKNLIYVHRDDDRGDGKSQYYLTIPIEQETALLVEQWRHIKWSSAYTKEHGSITYDEWKYDKEKRKIANDEMLKQGILEPLFKADEK